MLHFSIQPLEGTTGIYVITAGLPDLPVVRSQVTAPNALDAVAAFRHVLMTLANAPFPEVTCS